MEFLGLATLIITNIDSVALMAPTAVDDEEVEIPTYAEDDAAVQAQDNGQYPVGEPMLPVPKKNYGKACLPSEPCAATSNQTLIKWLPGKFTIEDLRNASEAKNSRARGRCGGSRCLSDFTGYHLVSGHIVEKIEALEEKRAAYPKES